MKSSTNVKAIDVVKQMVADGQVSQEVAEKYFPELKESEDERIRKSLLDYLYTLPNHFSHNGGLVTDWIAWLEKQGQTFTKKDVDDAYLKGICDTKNELEKQGEQKPAENKGMNLVEEEMTPFQKKVFCIIDTTIEEEQGLKQVCDELFALASNEIKQKPAWSKEDEKMYTATILALAGFMCNEDKIDWLKSLKDRVQAQKQWKPSEEMLEALYKVIPENVIAISEDEMLLGKLYQGLKYGRVLSKN